MLICDNTTVNQVPKIPVPVLKKYRSTFVHGTSHLCFRRSQDIAVHLKFLFWFFSFIEIWLKFKAACQNRQAGESAVKYLF